MKAFLQLAFLCLFFSLQNLPVFGQTAEKPNILFVVIDDLNDWSNGWGGHPQSNTPNITSLTGLGTTFLNAYCSAPQCGPSRTSFLTGKDPYYTNVHANIYLDCELSDNFTEATNNEEYFTLPGFLKDSAGYFTYSANKIFHCYREGMEWDSITEDPCAKELSWNKREVIDDQALNILFSEIYDEGVTPFKWGRVDPSYESVMDDSKTVDSVINFINQSSSSADITCGKPWFIALGIKKPHFPSFVPEEYWNNEYYMEDIYAEPYQIPYNFPEGSTPYNGIVIPPTTSPIRFADLDALPDDGMAAGISELLDQAFINFPGSLAALPVINDTLNDSMRNIIVENSMRANLILGYLASITYADAQFGRVMETLAEHPEMYDNTIVVVMGDHGFSLGEKRHWQKGALWETDIRSTFLVADLRNPSSKISKHMVSFLDVFPTICDFAGIPHPTFSDGSPYLDGKSLIPFMSGASLKEERPLLSSTRDKKDDPAGCFPHYSIRNERFHLIDYSVATGSIQNEDCMLTGTTERELYDIGVNRQTDPNEWFNLAGDPEYQPLIDYLLQWKPTGSMYMKQGMKVEILNKGTQPCYHDTDNLFVLRARIYDSLGTPLMAAGLSGYTVRWSNSATAAESFGSSLSFNMATVPSSYYTDNDHITFYMEVTNNTTLATTGFQMHKMFINPANEPTADYSLLTDNNRLSISDYTLSGSVNSVNWTFGDGWTVTDPIPGPHTYAAEGGYTVKHTLFHGNGCKKVYSDYVLIDSLAYRKPNQLASFYPNPAQTLITVIPDAEAGSGTIRILDITGAVQLEVPIEAAGLPQQLYVGDLANGTYLISIESNQEVQSSQVIISR